VQFADIETPSIQAYQHYIRYIQELDVGRVLVARREVDAALALDSGFIPALRGRLEMARDENDTATSRRLGEQIKNHPERGSEYDHLRADLLRAEMIGERTRGMAIARTLASRYPRDPRALMALSAVLMHQGHFASVDSILRVILALDSLGMASGTGPCAPCSAFGGLASLKMFLGQPSAAEPLLRRWIDLQPDAPVPWGFLADAYRFEGRYEDAYRAQDRAYALSNDDAMRSVRAHTFLESRQLASVDSAIADWRRRGPPREGSPIELEIMLRRERGQYMRVVDIGKRLPPDEGLDYVIANTESRVGDYKRARAHYERFAHPVNKHEEVMLGYIPTNDARLFSWSHALAADAYAPSGDTITLKAMSDSIRTVSQRSFYGRDLRLYHHVNGLIAMQRHDWRGAIDEFQQARWGAAGWTATVADIARCFLQLNQPQQAIRVLRDAYTGPLDAMGRYEPRSELDFLMARSFQQAGMRDSAAAYGAYVRRAWADADPAVKRRLAELRW
jgi:tetratricopeptide (TPR) repeat protein